MFHTTKKTKELTAREQEEKRLRRETCGLYAPAKPNTFYDRKRQQLVEKHIREGLEVFDKQNNTTLRNN